MKCSIGWIYFQHTIHKNIRGIFCFRHVLFTCFNRLRSLQNRRFMSQVTRRTRHFARRARDRRSPRLARSPSLVTQQVYWEGGCKDFSREKGLLKQYHWENSPSFFIDNWRYKYMKVHSQWCTKFDSKIKSSNKTPIRSPRWGAYHNQWLWNRKIFNDFIKGKHACSVFCHLLITL